MRLAQSVSQAREPRTFQSSLDNPSDWCPLVPELVAGKYSVQVATTVDAIEAVRPVWRKWAHSLDTDIDYFLHNLTHDSVSPRPYVITVYNEGIAQAMLVGQIRRRKTFSVVSFINVPGPHARVLEIKKGGRIGRPSPALDRLAAAWDGPMQGIEAASIASPMPATSGASGPGITRSISLSWAKATKAGKSSTPIGTHSAT